MITPKKIWKRIFTTKTHNAFVRCNEEIIYAKIRVEEAKKELNKLWSYVEKADFPESICISLSFYVSDMKDRYERLERELKCDASRIEDLLTLMFYLRQINEWYQGEEKEKEIRTLIKAFNEKEDERNGLLNNVPRRTEAEDKI